MRRTPGLLAFVCVAAIGAVPAYSTQFLYETVRVDPAAGTVFGPGMDGPSEPTASPGTGYGTVLYDNVAHTLGLDVTFSGLLGTTTNSHIHAPTAAPFTSTAGVATTTPTFAGFPMGVTSGSFSNVLDLTQASSWNGAYITANGGTPAGAEAAFAAALAQGKSYWNIHSSQFGGGEIRGFLRLVPEPGSGILIAIGVAAFAFSRRVR